MGKGTRPGGNEAHIAATLEYEAKLRGSQGLAYVPVVGAGRNALVLHYTHNDQQLA